MVDFEREMGRERWREGKEEPLVPDRRGGPVVVGFRRLSTVGIDPEDGVRVEIAVAPVHVLQLLRGDYSYVQLQRRWRC